MQGFAMATEPGHNCDQGVHNGHVGWETLLYMYLRGRMFTPHYPEWSIQQDFTHSCVITATHQLPNTFGLPVMACGTVGGHLESDCNGLVHPQTVYILFRKWAEFIDAWNRQLQSTQNIINPHSSADQPIQCCSL